MCIAPLKNHFLSLSLSISLFLCLYLSVFLSLYLPTYSSIDLFFCNKKENDKKLDFSVVKNMRQYAPCPALSWLFPSQDHAYYNKSSRVEHAIQGKTRNWAGPHMSLNSLTQRDNTNSISNEIEQRKSHL